MNYLILHDLEQIVKNPHPFGMVMPSRSFNGGDYRYGYNSKEKTDEIAGVGAVYDYGFRIYDARVARFLSTDPLFKSYPWYTPYQFAGNSPILNIDLDGLEDCDHKLFLEGLINGFALIIKINFPKVIVHPETGEVRGKWKIDKNNRYWTLRADGSTYKMKKGKSPADALLYYVNNKGGMSADCGQFVQIEILYAMYKSMGEKEFNRYILAEGRGNFLIKKHNSTGINQKEFYNRDENGTLSTVNAKGEQTSVADESKFYQDLPIGTRLWIKSTGYESSEFNGENIVKVGDDKYNAQGIGQGVSLQTIMEKLEEVQQPIEGQAQKIQVQEVTINQINLTDKQN